MLIVVVAGFGFALLLDIDLIRIAFIVAVFVVVVGVAGYIRMSSSKLTRGRRATFLFVGASVIGFSIWAAMTFALSAAGLMPHLIDAAGDLLFIGSTLVICLFGGAFIGELIGRIKAVQIRLFGGMD